MTRYRQAASEGLTVAFQRDLLLPRAEMDRAGIKSVVLAVVTILAASIVAFVSGWLLSTPLTQLLLAPTEALWSKAPTVSPSTPGLATLVVSHPGASKLAAGYAMVALLLPATLALVIWQRLACKRNGELQLGYAAAVVLSYMLGLVLAHQFALLPYAEMLVRLPTVPALEGMPIAASVKLGDYLRFSSRLLMTAGLLVALPCFAVAARLAKLMSLRALLNATPYVMAAGAIVGLRAMPGFFGIVYYAVAFVIVFVIGIGLARLLSGQDTDARAASGGP